ncbi:hypothetical protein Fuma_02848 [Fuerstiella marisgermanici]|uniref:Uncharacterized protein n=2 Tax=Fuerstiella marisgermanici TaxID=1891926 RepID=A0A1P8WGN3_9PLAN|nr:hypothetical protein Fuma_02848 [Fuerstiella marisgermanici]
MWRDIVNEQWQRDVMTDDSEIDMDLLAAFAEGRLSPQEQIEAEALIADSRAALECFVAMKESVIGERDHVLPEVASPEPHVGGQVAAARHQSLYQYATAASLLIGCLAVGWATMERSGRMSLQSEVASLSSSLETQTSYNLVSQKEQGMTLAATRTSPYFAGKLTQGMISTIVMSLTRPKSLDASVDPSSVASLSTRWKSATAESVAHSETSVQQSVEEVFRLITDCQLRYNADDDTLEANERTFAPARQALEALRQKYPEAPEVRNLEAVLLLQQAEFLLEPDADELTQRAKSILIGVTKSHPEFANAWLNRALLAQSEGDSESAAKEMWNRFADTTEDQDLREAVLQLLE